MLSACGKGPVRLREPAPRVTQMKMSITIVTDIRRLFISGVDVL